MHILQGNDSGDTDQSFSAFDIVGPVTGPTISKKRSNNIRCVFNHRSHNKCAFTYTHTRTPTHTQYTTHILRVYYAYYEYTTHNLGDIFSRCTTLYGGLY